MPFKHIFGTQIENMFLFFYVVATSKAITSDFSSAPDYPMSPKKMRSCVALCIYRFCFAGTSASAYRMGSSKASELFSKLAQLKCFEHVVERTFGLQGKHSILFTRLLLLLSLLSFSFDTRKRTVNQIYHQHIC